MTARCIILFVLFSIVALPACASKTPTEDVGEVLANKISTGCESELESFCKNITPGEGRVLACLYANGDKLSGTCEYALYDAAAQLDRLISAVSYVASECIEDIDEHCAQVEAGEGRLVECLNKNESKIDSRCSQALIDVGFK